jgi:2-aminoethylphosphonate aminotransferase
MSLVERKILLNPGPATTSEGVKRALLIPDVCPREQEFCALYADVRRRLALLAGDPDEITAIPLVGSGTAALEAALTSFVPPDGLALILDNGDYGERLVRIAATHGLPHRVLAAGWGRPLAVADVDTALADLQGRASHLVFVHHETSTGMLNPLEPLLEIARRRGVRTLVDGMSSFGAVPMRVGSSGADAVVASANKCLQGMPGLAFVVATRALAAAARGLARRTLFLSLVDELDHLESTGQSRFTVPPQIVSALQRALLELEAEGGPEARYARYRRSMAELERGLRALGFEPLLEPDQRSHILLAVHEPRESWYDFGALHDALYAQGYTIYPGKAGRTRCFRLSVLGDIDERDIRGFVTALAAYVGTARSRAAPPGPPTRT